jgi:hypothetical protein
MNSKMKTGQTVSIAGLAHEAEDRGLILASEGTLADRADLENAFIALVDSLYRSGAIQPNPADENESHLIQLFESGKLAENGYGGKEGDQFIHIQWIALTDNLPVITNLNL